MANMVLNCLVSPVMLNQALSSPTKFGLASKSVTFRGLTSSRGPMVVRAELEEDRLGRDVVRSNVDPLVRKEMPSPLTPLHLNKSVAMIDTSPYMRTPWNTTEDENEIRMWFDMPGLAAQDIDVHVVDNLLVIKGSEGEDAFGRKIHSPFDCKLHLPLYCAKEETQAVLKNGVLHISVPKITKTEHMKFIHVPVRAI